MPFSSSRQNTATTSFIPSTVLRYSAQNPQTTSYSTSTSPVAQHRWYASSTPTRSPRTPLITKPSQDVRTYINGDATFVEKLASSLASAFENDPVMLHVLGSNDTTRKNKNLLLSLLNIELSRPKGQTTIHVSEDDSTVAIWHHVNHWKNPFLTQVMLSSTLFRTIRWSTAMRFLNVMDGIEKCHPTEPHMHLAFMDTHAQMRGKGNGIAVISKMLRYCDSRRIPAYLESSNERNLTFYMRHGFKVTKKIPNLPQDCPPLFAMWREPKPILDNLREQ